jgi:hypothetical protein
MALLILPACRYGSRSSSCSCSFHPNGNVTGLSISICRLRPVRARPSTIASTIDGAINASLVRRAT